MDHHDKVQVLLVALREITALPHGPERKAKVEALAANEAITVLLDVDVLAMPVSRATKKAGAV